jgi:hypothetical protein
LAQQGSDDCSRTELVVRRCFAPNVTTLDCRPEMPEGRRPEANGFIGKGSRNTPTTEAVWDHYSGRGAGFLRRFAAEHEVVSKTGNGFNKASPDRKIASGIRRMDRPIPEGGLYCTVKVTLVELLTDEALSVAVTVKV